MILLDLHVNRYVNVTFRVSKRWWMSSAVIVTSRGTKYLDLLEPIGKVNNDKIDMAVLSSHQQAQGRNALTC